MQLEEALRYLAERCDGARSQDRQGFNGGDAKPMHRLASIPEKYWTERQKYDCYQRLRRYRRQLAENSIDYDLIPVPPEPTAISDRKISGRESTFRIYFPYEAGLVVAVKNFPLRRFLRVPTDHWAIPASKAILQPLQDFAEEHGFFMDQSAYDLMGRIEQSGEEPEKPQINAPVVNLRRVTPGKGGSFVVSFPYDSSLVAGIKTVPGARFQGGDKTWIVPADKARPLFDFGLRLGFDLGPLAGFDEEEKKRHGEAATKSRKLMADLDLDSPLPCGRKLFAHQREGVMRVLENSRQILALDIGTGKTSTALVAAKIYREKLDTITYVVGPASLRENWMREAELVETPIEYYSWAKVPEPPNVPYVFIGDEAHAMMTFKSLRTQRGLTLAEKAESVLLLTGTPIKSGKPVALYPLLKACKHTLADDKKAYEIRYSNAHATKFTRWDTTGAANLQELHEKTRDVIFRKTKKECLDLLPFTRVLRKAELSEEASENYHKAFTQLRNEYRRRLAAAEILTGGEALVMLGHLRHAGSLAKTETAIELAEEVIEQGSQVILFVAFKESGQIIAQSLKCEFFSGDLDTKDRQPMIDRFQTGEKKAIVCSIGAGSVGLNMQAANTIIMVDRSWSPSDHEQSEGRAHRSGQTQPVTSIFLQSNSTDEAIDALLLQKAERIELILNGKRKTMRGVSGEAEMAQEVLRTLFN